MMIVTEVTDSHHEFVSREKAQIKRANFYKKNLTGFLKL